MKRAHHAWIAVLAFLTLAALIRPTGAASLTVSTDATETGVQSYDSLLVTNGATYTVTGGGADVSITNTTMEIGKTSATGTGNLVVSNGAVFSFSGTSASVHSPNTTATSTLAVVNGTFNSTKHLVVGQVSSRPSQFMATDASSLTLAGVTVDSGSMLVSGNSQVVSTNFVRMAVDFAGATAQLDVLGSGTVLFVSDSILQAGRQGLGIINISDGAVVSNTSSSYSPIGDSAFGNATPGGTTGIVTVANGGKWINSGSFRLGSAGGGTVALGGGGIGLMTVQGSGSYVQGVTASLDAPGGFNSSLVITNHGYVQLTSQISVGSGTVQVASGGILEAQAWTTVAGKSGTISNTGGIYQFSTPFLTFNSNPGSIVLTDGTISFRNRADVNVYLPLLTNITYNGQNTFRLDSASNTVPAASTQNYTFDTGMGATNYTKLELLNGANWRSQWLNVGAGGTLLVSNSGASRVDAAVTNLGAIKVVNSAVTFTKKVLLQGSYVSDPSTNTFQDDVTVLPGGSLAGGAGDRFEFQKSLFISNSFPSAAFDLRSSTVAFTGGGMHTNSLSGIDYGYTNNLGLPDGFTPENFAYGRLTLASTNDSIQFLGGNGAVSNALYVDWLDLAGFTNQFANVSNMVTSLLFAPANIHVYYAVSSWNANNAYLDDQVYSLTGGGFLLPAIPEPSALVWFAMAAAAVLRRKPKRA